MKDKTQPAKRGNVSDHTPTPWKLDGYPDGKVPVSIYGLHGNNKQFVGQIYGQGFLAHPSNSVDEAKANATFIVRAVNSHEALLSVIKQALEKERGGKEPYEGYIRSLLEGVIVQAKGGK